MHSTLEIVDLGDARIETRQWSPMPIAFDNMGYYGWY